MADITASTDYITADNQPTGDISGFPPPPRRSGYTKHDLVSRILVRLGEVGFGQSSEPEARKRVADAMPGIFDELEQDRIYDFGLDDAVPGAAMDPLSAIIASRLADDFNLPQDEAVLLASRAQGAEVRLRRYRALPYVRQPARVDYF